MLHVCIQRVGYLCQLFFTWSNTGCPFRKTAPSGTTAISETKPCAHVCHFLLCTKRQGTREGCHLLSLKGKTRHLAAKMSHDTQYFKGPRKLYSRNTARWFHEGPIHSRRV